MPAANPNSTPRYVICPFFVRSQTDGQRHYVGVGQLLDLYGIRPGDNWVVYETSTRFRKQDDDVFLAPLQSGKYYNVHEQQNPTQ